MTTAPDRPVRTGSHRGDRGFTLIEVMVALVVFAVGALTLALCAPMSAKRVTASGVQTRASSLVAEKAENLLTTPYSDTALDPGTHDDPANPLEGQYYVRWVVEANQPIPQCKRVTITAARHGASGAPEATVVVVSPASGG